MDIIYNKNLQGIPAIRKNLDCGFDPNNIAAGREPCQMGWYDWIGKKYCANKIVLDVGAGMCDGMRKLRDIGSKEVFGQEIDARLQKLDKNLLIKNINDIDDKSFDIITCFDVIEHVIDDLEFFKNLLRIARERVCITTPNYSRSKAQNHCHCREYTIPQFANVFKPNELWSASPDGWVHHTKLLKIENGIYIDETRTNSVYKIGNIAESISFTHSTVDGNEWPHICGIFEVDIKV
jgi:2-polyprenyl-3-methyl-5-hydroxy-6-metoxy-1,4-benzoquinol methylase